MQIKIPHNLPPEIATEKIKSLFNNVKRSSGNTITNIKQNWNGSAAEYSFTAKGFNISGDIQVVQSLVVLNLNLPFAARLFKGKIKSVIEEEAKKVLG